jgi:hypothetical protein|eukprot:COSAG02_NODE_4271_length_5563_cov_3.829063_10_plen_80_part_00
MPLSLADSSVLTSSAVQNGADVMCPGLTSPGADMPDAEAGDVVVRVLCVCFPIACFVSISRCVRREFLLKASSTQWVLG